MPTPLILPRYWNFVPSLEAATKPFLVAPDGAHLTIKGATYVKIVNGILHTVIPFDVDTTYAIASILDTGTITPNSTYHVFVCTDGMVKVSLSETYPAGYTSLTSVAVGKFSVDSGGDIVSNTIVCGTESEITAQPIISENMLLAPHGLIVGFASAAPKAAFHGFGDSLTFGVGASTPANAYFYLLNNELNWTPDNQGISGSQVQDQINSTIYRQGVGVNEVSLWLATYNDMRHWGTDATAQAVLGSALKAAVAWLAIPDANKILAQSPDVVYTGAWNNTVVYGGGLGKNSLEAGATATFQVTGSTIYLGITAISQADSGFTVTVDGVNQGTFNCSPGVTSVAGVFWAPSLVRITGLTNAAHTVVLTVLGGGNYMYFDWAAGLDGSNPGPVVFVGNCLKSVTPTGYAMYPPLWSNGSDATVALFNALVANTVTLLSGDGLAVYLVDASAAYNPVNNCGDGIHPNDTGHLSIKTAFKTEIDAAIAAGKIPVVPDAAIPDYTGLIRFDGNVFQGFNGKSWENLTKQVGLWDPAILAEMIRVAVNRMVGVNTTDPQAQLDVNGMIRTVGSNVPASGSGFEIIYTPGLGYLGAYDRTNGVPVAFQVGYGAAHLYIGVNGNIGCGNNSPDAAALLDVISTTKGFRPPCMSTTNRDAIASPPKGLMIFNTTTNKLNVRGNTAWEAITSS